MNPEAITWDAVIVGTGMGGATLGYALAKSGWRVLFVERGLDLHSPQGEGIRDRFVEDRPGFQKLSEEEQERQTAFGGRSIDRVTDAASGRESFRPYIGCGTGGSSALYGMVLERLFPSDFARPPAAPDRGAAAQWPISYEELRPWYEAAERLYRVRGGADPLRPGEAAALLPPPPFSAEGASLVDSLLTQGVHPYRVHTACEERRGCLTCQGHLCGADCKNDAARICLIPAVNDHGATLMTECTAMAVEADRTAVHQLVCAWRGQRVVVRSKIFVVAAGALLTPVLLLNSQSACWPNGVANDSGLVGCNLMRHAIDLSVLTKAPRLRADRLTKEIAFNDFYVNGSEKLGSVQSFGVAMPLGYLRNRPGVNLWRWLGPFAPWFWKRYAQQPIFGAILEDSPSPDNRIESRGEIAGSGRYHLSVRYRLSDADLERRRRFRSVVGRVLAPFKPIRVWGTSDRPAFGHVCGTCRFGTDPASSVLDPWNRAHGLSNLFVVDASFFPTSGGINPALTIAANALRVAYHLQTTT